MEIKQQVIADAMRTEREALVSYLKELPEGAWDKATACDGWTIRDLVSHLIGNAKDIADLNIEGAGSVEYNQRQLDERAGLSPTQLLAEWAVEGPRFEEAILAQDDTFWQAPYLEFGTVGEAVQRLVEDIWVHSQDIRLPLGDDATTGPGLDATLDCVERELKLRVPRLAPAVGKVTIDTDGASRTVATGDGGQHVTISGDAVTIALAGTGRISLESAVSDGVVSADGGIPAGFADAFNIYGP